MNILEKDKTKDLILILSLITCISAIITNYPTYYVMYNYGIKAFFAGVLITQYSVRMSAIDSVAIISSLLCIFYSRKYFSNSAGKKRISSLLLILVTILSALLNYPTYYVAYHYGLSSLTKGVIITQYSTRATSILILLLAIQIYFIIMLLRGPVRTALAERQVKKQQEIIDQTEMLRIKLWRERNRSSRLLGLVMLILSGALFVLSYETAAFVYEVGALASFMIGAALILTQLEPRVKLYPASDALLGPLLALASQLKSSYGKYHAEFVANSEKSYMIIKPEDERYDNLATEPIGAGLVRSYEREIGELYNKGQDYVISWVSKAISQGLGLAEHVEIKLEDKTVYSVLSKPYIRSLCVQKEMTDNVCNTMGCPLVASIAESMAKATGKKVMHLECNYNPRTQTAVARHKIID